MGENATRSLAGSLELRGGGGFPNALIIQAFAAQPLAARRAGTSGHHFRAPEFFLTIAEIRGAEKVAGAGHGEAEVFPKV
jgi:hypothetical protein